MTVKIYHNPRCSKSRATLKLLRENGVETEVIEYLKTPPDKAELVRILDGLGMDPRDLMRRKEAAALGLAGEGVGRDALIDAMLENPILIERPVVENAGRYALGRPPESVLEIL